MKYQVLARKYRPRVFSTMMGQEHVLKALSNALNSERLHHAYLFTGTRGVGKTTIARILAKALNCEQGISAEPCGECSACTEIDQGRFIDLIEVDAASKTKVEDTRELLENVQYAPTRGRFKIYLIDEVHMLSGHSFNALLKTLEEPPPHAKFLLATTDPQKLPVTILSRCLQFNLKSLSIKQIEQQLAVILAAEQIPYTDDALKPLAIAADGSMRDALSLMDQAIAYSQGHPTLADIEAMLGSVQKDRIFELLNALAREDGLGLIEQSHILFEQGIDASTVLAELITTLQRIALCQLVPDAIDDGFGDQEQVQQIASLISTEDIQLYYQIALNGSKDLPYSPQSQGGFEMILLRMLAFKPRNVTIHSISAASSQTDSTEKIEPARTEKKNDHSLFKTSNINHNKHASNASIVPGKAVAEEVSPASAEKPLSTMRPEKNNKATSPGNTDKSDQSASAGKQQAAITPALKTVMKTAPMPEQQSNNEIQQNTSMPEEELPPIDAYNDGYFSSVEDFVDVPLYHESHSLTKTVSAQPVEPEKSSNATQTDVVQQDVLQQDLLQMVPTNQSQSLQRPDVQQSGRGHTATQQSSEQPPAAKEQQKPYCVANNNQVMADYWHELIKQAKPVGLEQQLAKHCVLTEKTTVENNWHFSLLLDSPHKHLLTDKLKKRLTGVLADHLQIQLTLDIVECQPPVTQQLDTPRRRELHEAEVLQQQAIESIHADPHVQMIVNAFSARIIEQSIKPIT